MIKCRIYDIINLELYVNDLNNCDIFNRESVTIQCIDDLIKFWQSWMSRFKTREGFLKKKHSAVSFFSIQNCAIHPHS